MRWPQSASEQDSSLYSPYGEVYGGTGSSQTSFGFTGEPTDANGLVHLICPQRLNQ